MMTHSQEEALQAHNTTLSTLANLSWTVNWDKSSLKPSQAKEFLGLIIDTTSELRFWVLVAKSHALHHNIVCLLLHFCKHHQVPVQHAAVAGHCMSLARAVLPTWLLLCNLFHNISKQSNWDSQICLMLVAVSGAKWCQVGWQGGDNLSIQ